MSESDVEEILRRAEPVPLWSGESRVTILKLYYLTISSLSGATQSAAPVWLLAIYVSLMAPHGLPFCLWRLETVEQSVYSSRLTADM